MYVQVGLLNVDGYYDSLLALFDKGVEDGFIDDSARNIVLSANTPQELIKKMEVYPYLNIIYSIIKPNNRFFFLFLSENRKPKKSLWV